MARRGRCPILVFDASSGRQEGKEQGASEGARQRERKVLCYQSRGDPGGTPKGWGVRREQFSRGEKGAGRSKLQGALRSLHQASCGRTQKYLKGKPEKNPSEEIMMRARNINVTGQFIDHGVTTEHHYFY